MPTDNSIDTPLYIHGLKAENFLRLELVELHLGGPGLTIVSGENAQGKSSLLKAIMAALGGKAALPEKPVRKGAKRAEVELDLGDKRVLLRVNADGTAKLAVEGKDGAVFRKPQELLNAIVGQFAFDPLKLLRQKPAERLATVRKLVGIDTSQADSERAKLYAERTVVGRVLETLQGQLAGLAVPEDPGPYPQPAEVPPRVDVLALAQEQRAALEQQRDNAIVRTALVGHEALVEQYEEQVEEMRMKLAEAEELLAQEQKLVAEYQAKVAALVDPDLAALTARLASAEEQNRAAEAAARANEQQHDAHRARLAARTAALAAKEAKATEVKAKADERQRLSDAIDAIDAAKVRLLDGVTFPVAGMGFGDDDLTFQGIPFAQCSASEQLRVCLATGAALNPRLRLLLVESGNDLDQTRLREMAAWAKEQGMEVLLERVAGPTPVGVVIEAGKVAGDYREAT